MGEWKTKHLEQKSIEREKKYSENKNNWKSKEDYLKAVKEGTKRQDKEKEITEADEQFMFDYNNFKMKYEAGKGNESIEGTIKDDPKLKTK